jgi:hypothetical protein
MPSLLRIASASRSGSPGISGPLVPGGGLVLRKTRIHSDLHGAEEMADPFANGSVENEGRRGSFS